MIMKWIILGIVLYLLAGFTTNLIIQIHDHGKKFEDSWLFVEDNYNSDEIVYVIVLWWFFVFIGILFIVIPGIIKGLYKLFVMIVFGIIAIFKRGNENGQI